MRCSGQQQEVICLKELPRLICPLRRKKKRGMLCRSVCICYLCNSDIVLKSESAICHAVLKLFLFHCALAVTCFSLLCGEQLTSVQVSSLLAASLLWRGLKSEYSPLSYPAFQKNSCTSSRSSAATRELPAAPAHSHERRPEGTCQQQD